MLRAAGWLTAQRVTDLAFGALFALVVPRAMGPEVFGRFVLLAAIAQGFALLSSLSATQVAVRFVPALAAQATPQALQRFCGALLVRRLLVGTLAAGAYFALTALWLRDVDRGALAAMAGTVLVRPAVKHLLALLLGLGAAARWGLGEALERWLAIALLVPGHAVAGLRGACLGVLVAELALLVVSLAWTRRWLRWSHLRVDRRHLAPWLAFGRRFVLAGFVLAAAQRSAEAVLQLAGGGYTEVGRFALAYRGYLGAGMLVWHLSMAFAPLLGELAARGEREELGRWVEQLLAAGAVAAMTSLLAAVLVGDDLVALLFGPAYAPAAQLLAPLAVGVLGWALAIVARLCAVVLDRWRTALAGGGLQLAALWLLGLPLATRDGARGLATAVAAAALLHAGFALWRLRSTIVVSAGIPAWLRAVALGLPPLALAWLEASPLRDVSLLLGGLAAYGVALSRAGVVGPTQLAAWWMAARSASPAPAAGDGSST